MTFRQIVDLYFLGPGPVKLPNYEIESLKPSPDFINKRAR